MSKTLFFLSLVLVLLSMFLKMGPSSQANPPKAFATLPKTSNLPRPMDGYIYPNSIVLTSNGNSLVLESRDNPAQITAWYKEKIRQNGMHTLSVVQTNTNGEILNQIGASKNSQNLKLSISKNAAKQVVKIEIERNG